MSALDDARAVLAPSRKLPKPEVLYDALFALVAEHEGLRDAVALVIRDLVEWRDLDGARVRLQDALDGGA